MLDPKASLRLASTLNSFSTSVNHQVRAKVLREVGPLLEAPAKCKEIWAALQFADYKKTGTLSSSALQVVVEQQREALRDLLMVSTVEDLLDLLDEDEDGYLNEDEQILLFSAVKERMQSLAHQLCGIHEYKLYKELMKAIRDLEKDIVNYQQILRSRTQTKELAVYHEIGQEKLQAFAEKWEQRLSEFHRQCSQGLITPWCS